VLLQAHGIEVMYDQCDIREEESVQKFVQKGKQEQLTHNITLTDKHNVVAQSRCSFLLFLIKCLHITLALMC
jgi:hypothetical protein